ncbi:hypothetical protein CSUB01_05057 [Colletotrichum sublineola]|uniref:Uncharacterized protein n=1 Tax=Colletotrichum sublineola TaxID=1173701 RepID=A0A066XXL5_COLSU|nr:hypothetical protein CSUB01_05057 [Colletotrichum sublineola]
MVHLASESVEAVVNGKIRWADGEGKVLSAGAKFAGNQIQARPPVDGTHHPATILHALSAVKSKAGLLDARDTKDEPFFPHLSTNTPGSTHVAVQTLRHFLQSWTHRRPRGRGSVLGEPASRGDLTVSL